ncbi:MAG: ribbon-helix-helix domain-containing protein [Parachlamydia sp.]|nr:ribbon-helix-helix domain-containing protein [Parachlamydia sp.]
MIRTQIYLTENERKKLSILCGELGMHQSAIIREAIDQYIERKLIEKQNKRDALQAASGLWANRKDLPDFSSLRKEFDRQKRHG